MRVALFAHHPGEDATFKRIETEGPEAAGVALARLLRAGWGYVTVDNIAVLDLYRIEHVDPLKIGDDQPSQV